MPFKLYRKLYLLQRHMQDTVRSRNGRDSSIGVLLLIFANNQGNPDKFQYQKAMQYPISCFSCEDCTKCNRKAARKNNNAFKLIYLYQVYKAFILTVKTIFSSTLC